MYRSVARRTALLAVVGSALFAPLTSFAADDYPSRPVTVIVPYPPGGNADVAIRVLSESLERVLGVSVVVTPTPGAGGATGVQKALGSRPDGYTVLVSAQSSITIPSQVRKLKFEWDSPTYLATIAAPAMYIGTKRDAPKFKTFDEFVKYAKAHPDELNMAQVGKAGLHEVTMLRIKKSLGIQFRSIPFNGGPPSVAAVLGGHADALITDNFNDAILPLAMTGEQSPHYPGVKTLTELGHADIASGVNYIVAVPKGTPEPVAKKIEAAFAEAIKDAKYKQVLASLKWTPLWRDRASTNEHVKTEAMAVKALIADGVLAKSTD